MPPKKQRGQKIDTSKLFGENKEETFDWAAGHNYDEDQAQEDQARKGKSPAGDDRNRVAITKAASFGNFRDEGQMTAGVPNDMEAPFVAFVKTFGRSVNEEVMKSYFPNMEINHVLIINNDKALFAFVEFDSRDDLANALLVTGAKMMYQHPCTVDVAAPEQIQKYQNSMNKRQPRSMHGRSPTSPKVDFDRDNVFGSTSAPDVDIDDLAAEDSGNASGRGGRGGRGGAGGFRGMSKSGSANFDAGRDSIFGSAEPVPNTSGGVDNNGEEGMAKRPGRFAGGKIGVSSASAQFGEISRDSVFGSASATASPNPTGRPQFGRNASKDSFESDQQSDKSAPKEAPAFSRDIFGKAEVPAARTTPNENDKDENGGGENGEDGNNNNRRGGPRSPNSRSPRNNNNNNIEGRDGFFGSRESGKNTSDSNGNSGRRKEGGGNNNGFSRRSPTTQKESDVGDRFGNFRSEKPQQQQQAPPPPPVAKDSTGAGSSKPSYASLASGGGNWRS